jgi:hypothetical protein
MKALLAKLNKQHRVEEGDNRAKYAERTNGLLERGMELAELTTQKEKETAEAQKTRTKFEVRK